MAQPIPLRVEDPPDATVIIRAGLMSRATISRSAQRTFDLHGIFGISAEGVLAGTVVEVCSASPRIGAYPRIRLSTFGRVRAAGFPFLATFESPHFTIVLPDLAELTLARLVRTFDEPIPNPAGSMQR